MPTNEVKRISPDQESELAKARGSLNHAEIPGYQEASRQAEPTDNGTGEKTIVDEQGTLAGVRDVLTVAGATEAQSDKVLRTLTQDEAAAILNGDEEALKKLGFKKLETGNGAGARALTDVLNFLERRN